MMNVTLLAHNHFPANLTYNEYCDVSSMKAEAIDLDVDIEYGNRFHIYRFSKIYLDKALVDEDTIDRIRGCMKEAERLNWEQQIMLAEIVAHRCKAEAVHGVVSLFKFSFKLAFALYEIQCGQWARFSSMNEALDHGSIEEGFEARCGSVLVRRYL